MTIFTVFPRAKVLFFCGAVPKSDLTRLPIHWFRAKSCMLCRLTRWWECKSLHVNTGHNLSPMASRTFDGIICRQRITESHSVIKRIRIGSVFGIGRYSEVLFVSKSSKHTTWKAALVIYLSSGFNLEVITTLVKDTEWCSTTLCLEEECDNV